MTREIKKQTLSCIFAYLLIFLYYFHALQGSSRYLTSCRTSVSQDLIYHEEFNLLKIICITIGGEIIKFWYTTLHNVSASYPVKQ